MIYTQSLALMDLKTCQGVTFIIILTCLQGAGLIISSKVGIIITGASPFLPLMKVLQKKWSSQK